MQWTRMVGLVVAGAVGGGCEDATTVVVQIDGPSRVALQDGDGPWLPVVADAAGRAEIVLTSDHYGLAFLCSDSFGHSTTVVWSTQDTQVAGCGRIFTEFVTLSGVTSPGATVVADRPIPVDASGTYATSLIPGVHDVFAILPGAPARLLIERGVDLSTDRTLDLPVATNGVAMPLMTPTVVGATGPVSIYSDLNTATNQYVVFGEDPTTVPVPPASVLIAGDQAAIGATSAGCIAQQPLAAAPPTLTLPQPLVAQIAHTSLTWQADPSVDWDFLRFELSGSSPQALLSRIALRAFVGDDWLASSGADHAMTIPALSDLPGWQTDGAAFTAGVDIDWALDIVEGQPEAAYHSCGKTGSFAW